MPHKIDEAMARICGGRSSRGEAPLGPPLKATETGRSKIMAVPTKGLTNIRTLSGRVDQVSLPYRSYMQITCLEMEKAGATWSARAPPGVSR